MGNTIALPGIVLPGLDFTSALRKAVGWALTAFTNAGTAIITNRINGAGTTPLYLAWGTGSAGASVVDAQLGVEIAQAGNRVAGTATRITTSVTNDTFQASGTITATLSNPITEAGLFDANTAGNMCIRSVFAAINVVNNDSLALTFKFQLQAVVA